MADGDRSDSVVGHVSYIEIAGRIEAEACRLIEIGAGGRNQVCDISGIAVTGDGGDIAGTGGDFADAIISRIGNEQISGAVDKKLAGCVQLCCGGSSAIAATAGRGRARSAGARNRSDVAGPRIRVECLNLAYTIVRRIGNVEVIGAVNEDAAGTGQAG